MPTLLFAMCSNMSVLQANRNFETGVRKNRGVTSKHCGAKGHDKMSSPDYALYEQLTTSAGNDAASNLNSSKNVMASTNGRKVARHEGYDDISSSDDDEDDCAI